MDNKIIFSSGTEFTEAAYPDVAVPSVEVGRLTGKRQYARITVTGTVEETKAAFTDGVEYRREIYTQKYEDVYETDSDGNYVLDAAGNKIVTGQAAVEGEHNTAEQVLTEYCIAGDIIDHRNGTCSVIMMQKTEQEKLEDTIDELVLETLGGATE